MGRHRQLMGGLKRCNLLAPLSKIQPTLSLMTSPPRNPRCGFRLPSRSEGKRGFTLIELLVVITILGLLMAISVPQFLGAMAGSRLATVGDQVLAILSSAREIANAEGRVVEVRVYKYRDQSNPDDPTSGRFHSMVLLRLFQPGEPDPTSPTGAVLAAPMALLVGDKFDLPHGTAFSEDPLASSLLMDQSTQSSAAGAIQTMIKTGSTYTSYAFPASGASYSFFRFRPDTTNLNPGAGVPKWCITAMHTADIDAGKTPPAVPNFYCIQVDAVNGRITSYRPTL
jgi:uncharacterized protein (TIGR02596 family)